MTFLWNSCKIAHLFAQSDICKSMKWDPRDPHMPKVVYNYQVGATNVVLCLIENQLFLNLLKKSLSQYIEKSQEYFHNSRSFLNWNQLAFLIIIWLWQIGKYCYVPTATVIWTHYDIFWLSAVAFPICSKWMSAEVK